MKDLIEGFNVTPDETFLEWLRSEQNNLIEKEKEQIILSYDAGFVNGAFDKPRTPKKYYNQTYNQNN